MQSHICIRSFLNSNPQKQTTTVTFIAPTTTASEVTSTTTTSAAPVIIPTLTSAITIKHTTPYYNSLEAGTCVSYFETKASPCDGTQPYTDSVNFETQNLLTAPLIHILTFYLTLKQQIFLTTSTKLKVITQLALLY